MSLQTLRDSIPDAAKDIRLNLGSVLSAEGSPELTDTQRELVALAVAYATQHNTVATAIEAEVKLDEAHRLAAKTAASLMAMNNVYYRFLHLSEDAALKKLPARLRMNGLANHGIEKKDFELAALAVSAVNGCGMCIEAHIHEVRKHNISDLAIQSSARIAAVLTATAQALSFPQ